MTVGAIFAAAASTTSDLVTLFELAIAGLLIVGMFLVRAGHVRVHKILQSSMVLVNVPVVLAWMVPQYLSYVYPDLPGKLLQPYYLLPTVALVAGVVAEGLGVFILLVAGTNWIPERWRFRRYKLWMRTELALWWTIVVLGLCIYYVWYVIPPTSGYSSGWT